MTAHQHRPEPGPETGPDGPESASTPVGGIRGGSGGEFGPQTGAQGFEGEPTALRDRIAAAIWERQNPGRHWADCEYRWRADAEEDADAVLAVLPEPVDRAAVLTEAECTMLTYALDQAQERIWSEDGFTDEDQAAVTSLRRLAAEATPEPATHSCGNCEGIDPDTCLANETRAAAKYGRILATPPPTEAAAYMRERLAQPQPDDTQDPSVAELAANDRNLDVDRAGE